MVAEGSACAGKGCVVATAAALALLLSPASPATASPTDEAVRYVQAHSDSAFFFVSNGICNGICTPV